MLSCDGQVNFWAKHLSSLGEELLRILGDKWSMLYLNDYQHISSLFIYTGQHT